MLVTIVIPARSWDARLTATLDSVAGQDLPAGVDVEVVVGLAEPAPVPHPRGVHVVANPSGTIPDALNLAIEASSGEIVIRVDARCLLQSDHVARSLKGLDDPRVGCVGGAALVLDRGLFGSTYAMAFSSPLLGPTVYRYRRTSGQVDTAYLGAWRRRDLEDLGGFDPALIRNQDNELAERVRSSGMTVYYDADLVVGYHNDRGLVAALRHHHEFGLWRFVQRTRGRRALTPRHVAALSMAGLTAVAGLSSLFNGRTRPYALRAAACTYAAAGAASCLTATRLRQARPDIEGPAFHLAAPALAPGLATLINGAWLAGILRGANRSRRASGAQSPRNTR